jgi:stage II sporulation protein AA (anti-sigma F factor antagonist)
VGAFSGAPLCSTGTNNFGGGSFEKKKVVGVAEAAALFPLGGGRRLNVQTKRVGANLVVRLSGELDLHTAEHFRQIVDGELASGKVRNLVLVLKDVPFIDSSGVGAILGRYRLVHGLQGKLVVTGLRPAVKRVLEMSGVLSIMETADSERRALARL